MNFHSHEISVWIPFSISSQTFLVSTGYLLHDSHTNQFAFLQPVINYTENLFLHLLAIHTYYFDKCLIRTLAHINFSYFIKQQISMWSFHNPQFGLTIYNSPHSIIHNPSPLKHYSPQISLFHFNIAYDLPSLSLQTFSLILPLTTTFCIPRLY